MIQLECMLVDSDTKVRPTAGAALLVSRVQRQSLADDKTGRDESYVSVCEGTQGEQRLMSDTSANITALLRAAASGERRDLDALMNAIYGDMRRLAESHLRSEREDHTLQPTALVHEAYLKLIAQHSTDWKDRAHFFAIAARIIRRILVDHARQKQAAKRGADLQRLSLEHTEISLPEQEIDLIALDEALEELTQLNARQAKIVEMRFFGGLTIEEIAESLEMGRRSVDREWSAAKAWLFFRLSDDDPQGEA